MGSSTGATGENWGAPKVGRSLLIRGSPCEPRVIAAMERMSMRPEPSEPPLLLTPGRGAMLAGAFGDASASGLDSEKSTEFSWRWPVSPPPAPLPPPPWTRMGDSAGAAEPKENEEAGSEAALTGDAKRSALGE